jgi:hypothetical protein
VRENCIVLPRYERDANLADFGHAVGHDCVHCDAIREMGPAQIANHLVRLMGAAKGDLVVEPPKSKRDLRNENRKRIGRAALLHALRKAS